MTDLPDDVEGECNAHCYIADDHGDNSATMRCQQAKNHEGLHKEEFPNRKVCVTWEVDERDYEKERFSKIAQRVVANDESALAEAIAQIFITCQTKPNAIYSLAELVWPIAMHVEDIAKLQQLDAAFGDASSTAAQFVREELRDAIGRLRDAKLTELVRLTEEAGGYKV